MSRQITLELNDALYNAGILGFIRICNICNIPFEINGSSLNFSSDIFENFTQAYLDSLIYVFEKDTIYTEILSRYDKIKHSDLTEKDLIDCLKYILEKVSRASYESGYKIINKRGEPFDFSQQIKQIKSEKQMDEKILLLDTFMLQLKAYKDVFLLKDIAYTKIQTYWSNAAFLLKTSNTSEFSDSYEKSFTSKAYSFLPLDEKKAKKNCCQCITPVSSGNSTSMSWVSDLGIDVNRKTSNYWNFCADSYLCPVCSLIYSCIPFGFTIKGSDGIFINQNQNIKDLVNINSITNADHLDTNTDIYWNIFQQFIFSNEQNNARYELQNIQVIRRMGNRYFFNILSKDKLKLIIDCKSSFQRITTVFINIRGRKVSLYREVLNHVLNGSHLYTLIHTILYNSAENNSNAFYLISLIQIQTHLFLKGDSIMNDKINYSVALKGNLLRNSMGSDERNANKIRSLSFHLLNHLKSRNPEKFADSLLRQYISLSLPAPDFITNILSSDEKFLTLGYSFVAGLNGCIKKGGE